MKVLLWLLCRLGFHDWQVVKVFRGGSNVMTQFGEQCRRCGEREVYCIGEPWQFPPTGANAENLRQAERWRGHFYGPGSET